MIEIPSLTLNDLIFLQANKLSLRHNYAGIIQKEAKHGGRGDAVSLAAPLRNLTKAFTKSRRDDPSVLGIRPEFLAKDQNGILYYKEEKCVFASEDEIMAFHRIPYFLEHLEGLDDSELHWSKQKLLEDFQAAIKEFISTNYRCFSREKGGLFADSARRGINSS